MKVIRISSVVTAVALAGFIFTAGGVVATATSGHTKPGVCHPVEGKGETGYGWNLIKPDEASKHMDEHGTADLSDDTGKHTRKDGRTDVYAFNGVCPGAPVETTTGGTPSTTTTAPSSTTTTQTQTETTPPTTTTGTTSTAPSSSPPPTTMTSSPTSSHPVTPTRSRSGTTRPSVTSSPTSSAATPRRSQPDTLAFTGVNTAKVVWSIIIGLLLVGLGVMAIRAARRRKH